MLRPGQTLRLPARCAGHGVPPDRRRVSTVQAEAQRFLLAEADTACVPGYSAVSLRNASADAPAFVFIADETPLHTRRGNRRQHLQPQGRPCSPARLRCRAGATVPIRVHGLAPHPVRAATVSDSDLSFSDPDARRAPALGMADAACQRAALCAAAGAGHGPALPDRDPERPVRCKARCSTSIRPSVGCSSAPPPAAPMPRCPSPACAADPHRGAAAGGAHRGRAEGAPAAGRAGARLHAAAGGPGHDACR